MKSYLAVPYFSKTLSVECCECLALADDILDISQVIVGPDLFPAALTRHFCRCCPGSHALLVISILEDHLFYITHVFILSLWISPPQAAYPAMSTKESPDPPPFLMRATLRSTIIIATSRAVTSTSR